MEFPLEAGHEPDMKRTGDRFSKQADAACFSATRALDQRPGKRSPKKGPSSKRGASGAVISNSAAAISRDLAALGQQPTVGASTTSREQQAVGKILKMLHRQEGVDFTHYRIETLERRIQRRAKLGRCGSLESYLRRLREDPLEVHKLFDDILIHVSGFFRDAPVFQALRRKVLPHMIKERPPEEAIRVWVPGCSTGEEVYSLAIELVEFLTAKKASFRVQFFGTDVSMAALERARQGVYSLEIATQMSTDRLRRYFSRVDNGYQIHSSIRRKCIFARHDVAADPPFSNLDLVSCRNLLIYLKPELQKKVIAMFHESLKPDGCLLLGKTETTGGNRELFSSADSKCKVYCKNDSAVVSGAHSRSKPRYGFSPAASLKMEVQLKPPENHERAVHPPVDRHGPFEKAANSASHFPLQAPDAKTEDKVPGSTTRNAQQMREELVATRKTLEAIIEQQEATNEELRTSNEVAEIFNQELETAKEELMATNEELMVTNEDLTASNDEREHRNRELEEAHNDLGNLLTSVDIPMVMVTRDMRIRLFTAVAQNLLNLIPSDVGRPLTDLHFKIELPDLDKMVREVIDSLEPKEVEVQDRDQRWWSVRVRPYKTKRQKIDGAVIAFVDIHILKLHSEEMHQGLEFAKAVAETLGHPVIVLDNDLRITVANRSFCRTFRLKPGQVIQRRIYDLDGGRWNIPRLRELMEQILQRKREHINFEVESDFSRVGRMRIRCNARQLDYAPENQILLAMTPTVLK
jgi:two-component system, chemotaxis family, CheB/CheR fusion protein